MTMDKMSITELSALLAEKNAMQKSVAKQFVATAFDLIKEALQTEGLVKVKGLGTFKIINVDARESVSVITGERMIIDKHQKITFTPDATMRELVNKPFSHFETVVLNEGVDFSDLESSNTDDDDVADETTDVTEEPANDSEQQKENIAAIEETEPEPMPEPVSAGEPLPESVSVAEPLPGPAVDEVAPEEIIISEEPQVVPLLGEEPQPVYEEEPEQPAEEPQPVYEEEPEPVDEVLQPVEEEPQPATAEQKQSIWKTVLPCLASLLIGLAVGYFIGRSSLSTVQEKPLDDDMPIIEITDTLPYQEDYDSIPGKQDSTLYDQSEYATPLEMTDTDEQADDGTAQAEEFDSDIYEQMDQRVRLGAYKITGVALVAKAQQGDNLAKLSKRYLGDGMECYVEVLNNMQATDILKEGQEIKIPALKWKKSKKK